MRNPHNPLCQYGFNAWTIWIESTSTTFKATFFYQHQGSINIIWPNRHIPQSKRVKHTLKKVKFANKNHYLSILFLNSQPDKKWTITSRKLFNSIVQSTLIYPLLNHNLNLLPPSKTATEPETQNHLSILKPGDTDRISTNKEKTWDTKGSVIAPNDRPSS